MRRIFTESLCISGYTSVEMRRYDVGARVCVSRDPRVHAGKQAGSVRLGSAGSGLPTIEREKGFEMRFLALLVLLLGSCEYRANDDIRTEIDEREPREARHVRDATLAEILENAVQAYLDEDWDRCISAFNDALYG